MKTIQAKIWSQKWGWHWEDHITVPDISVNSTLQKLRYNNHDTEFRVDEIESDSEYQQHQRHGDLVHSGRAAA